MGLLISIITVNYNDAKGLEETIKSVQSQSCKNYEHIIIDGNSTDGSKEILEKHKDSFTYWVSEPDLGIYNAMNKGIDKAIGDYLLFLNSGDSFNNHKVLDVFVLHKPFEDIVYGNSLFFYPNEEPQLKIMPSNLEGMTIFSRTLNHQSVFHHKRIFEKGKRYNEKYKMLADWVLYNEVVLLEKGSYRHIDLLIANYDANGFSSKPENKTIMEVDRNKFYAANVEYFIPLLTDKIENLKKRNTKLRSLRILKFYFKIKKYWSILKIT